MPYPQNPFTPTAGVTPRAWAGHEIVIANFIDGLEEGVGAPERLMRLTGLRGSGKTSMLQRLGDEARTLGWTVVDVTAKSSHLAEDVLVQLALLNPAEQAREGAGIEVNLGLVKASYNLGKEVGSNGLRVAFDRLLSKKGEKLLITVDEVHAASMEDMSELSIAYQHAVRKKYDIAFVFAGLPSPVNSLINRNELTFLRRALPFVLTPVSIGEARDAMEDTLQPTGIVANPDALDAMAKASEGYPFMIQHVGYQTWREAKRRNPSSNNVITLADVHRALPIATQRFEATVLEPALVGLSEQSVEYLIAMACELGDSQEARSSSVAARLGKTTQELSTVRASLIDLDLIESPGRNLLRFTLPYMPEYLLSKYPSAAS